jgi:hypothetical protein
MMREEKKEKTGRFIIQRITTLGQFIVLFLVIALIIFVITSRTFEEYIDFICVVATTFIIYGGLGWLFITRPSIVKKMTYEKSKRKEKTDNVR